ncbi:hypothetical protein FHETE_8291 [Fusarium heterosporum]|uniref:Uncharacterized protein n=1 Tax=Fusarium heterosporum TaxID=42747 RepID=A0A8H5WJ04_FUSHE|nr:hypothetical protein FHETE_8291 [Fusarium heterosporum]
MADEVSGTAAFWLLLSLAAAAVAQPTTGEWRKNRNHFGGSIDPTRCIPAVCLVDAICDSSLLGISLWKTLSKSKSAPVRHRVLPKASALIAKLALSTLTVLPQTIKVFSLKGVTGTQACAFIFFYAFVTKLLVDLCGLEEEAKPIPPKDRDDSLDLIVLVALLLQIPFEIWIWYNISGTGKLTLPRDLETICTWSSMACYLIMTAQALVWVMYLVARQRFDVSRSPHVVPLRLAYAISLVLGVSKNPVTKPRSQGTIIPPPQSLNRLSHALSLMFAIGVASIIITKSLDALVSAVITEKSNTTAPVSITSTSESSATQEEENKSQEDMPPSSPTTPFISRIGTVGTAIDRWLMRALSLNSAATSTIALTVFNLTTTIIYYLVCFDGTGTDNPGWTSILG